MVIACAELRTCRQYRRKAKRQNLWVWTVVVPEMDGRRWADLEVGDRREQTFLRLYEKLLETVRYDMDDYPVYGWLPAGRHRVGKAVP